MRVYAFETPDGKFLGNPFVAEDDEAAKRQVITVFAPVVLGGNTEYVDLAVVCLFSFDPADPSASLISLHEDLWTVEEVFAEALLKYLAARPGVDFDKLKEEVLEDA